jgi:hypothetical protein
MGNGFRSQHELVCHASKGVPNVYDKGIGNVFRHPRVEPVDHPSPKPEEVMQKLIRCVTPARRHSCSTRSPAPGRRLRAAKNIGTVRDAIGIESVEAHCETTACAIYSRVARLVTSGAPVGLRITGRVSHGGTHERHGRGHDLPEANRPPVPAVLD